MFRVTIAGRPNVGKSAIFNRLLGRRRSLVHDLAGMTRDVLEERAELEDGRPYILVDTGGFDPAGRETIPAEIRRRALAEIGRADLVLLVLDSSAGILPADRETARVIKKAGKDCLVLANKIDRREGAESEGEAYALGFPEVIGFSAEHNLGKDEVLAAIARRLPAPQAPEAQAEARAEAEIAVAIVGRPNVGKSSLLNALTGSERTIVSEAAGTTRDSIDALVEIDRQQFRFVDTAGIRRKSKTEQGPEVLSVVTALKRLERCDVALVIFDASAGATSQDATVAATAAREGRGVILVANKWDAVADPSAAEEFREEVFRKFSFVRFAPLLLVSARSGRGVSRVPAEVVRVAGNRLRRVATALVNRVIGDETRHRPVKGASGRPLKILYASQTGVAPPVFTLVASREEELYFSDSRRLENVLRRAADFSGVPIRFHVAGRRRARPR